MAFQGALKTATLSGKAIATTGGWIARLWGRAGTGVKTVAGTGLALGAADLLVVPAIERVSGTDIKLGTLDLGTIARDGLTGAGESIAGTLGQIETAGARAFAEGGIKGLFPGIDSADSKQIVTFAILAIGGVLLIKMATD